MMDKNKSTYQELLSTLKDYEKYDYPIDYHLLVNLLNLSDYDKNAHLIGFCHCMGYLLYLVKEYTNLNYRRFVQNYTPIKTDKDRFALKLLHLCCKQGQAFFEDLNDKVLRVLKYGDTEKFNRGK